MAKAPAVQVTLYVIGLKGEVGYKPAENMMVSHALNNRAKKRNRIAATQMIDPSSPRKKKIEELKRKEKKILIPKGEGKLLTLDKNEKRKRVKNHEKNKNKYN